MLSSFPYEIKLRYSILHVFSKQVLFQEKLLGIIHLFLKVGSFSFLNEISDLSVGFFIYNVIFISCVLISSFVNNPWLEINTHLANFHPQNEKKKKYTRLTLLPTPRQTLKYM